MIPSIPSILRNMSNPHRMHVPDKFCKSIMEKSTPTLLSTNSFPHIKLEVMKSMKNKKNVDVSNFKFLKKKKKKDAHIGIYDFGNNLFYASNASPYVNGTYTPAYYRPFVRLNMTEAFALQPN